MKDETGAGACYSEILIRIADLQDGWRVGFSAGEILGSGAC